MVIRHATVLGAGTMGAQIAAHLANAGVPSLLLDVTPQAAADGLARARGLKPDPFYTPDTHRLVSTGGFDEHLQALSASDWIVEAVVERLDVKQALFERVERHRRTDAIVTSNTSGIPIASLAGDRSSGFRARFFGTHFFNPPRYLRLLEVIPTGETDPGVLDAFIRFADVRLGKGVVVAKDSPNFIANHIGMHGLAQVFRALDGGAFTIEEIDAMTGPAIGRPKSATFRTVDIAGLDVLAHVARNLQLPLPPFVDAMIARGTIGAKSGAGFYRRTPDGSIETLDPQTLEYRPKQAARLPALDAARSIEDHGARIRALYEGRDRVGEFLRATLGPTLDYVAEVAPRIAHSAEDVDRAMRWGFGWELGPFAIRRALEMDPAAPAVAKPTRTVRKNAGASLVDLGDGVLSVQFHSKMNAIGGDTIQMLQAGVKEAAANFAALVVGNEALHFSAGANLMLLLLEAQEGNWDDVALMVRAFQGATMALKHAPVPVVVAPAGLAIGGGCEIVLHGTSVQGAAEAYIGLVEVGVGLIPAGGGTKEMLARAMDAAPPGADALPSVQGAFETIAFAKTSASGPDAVRLGYLRDADGITMNRDRLLEDAKQRALALARSHVPARPRTAIPVGGADTLAALKLGVHLALRAGRISDHDALIGRKLAWIMAGGDTPHATTLSEQQLLDLEREAFLSLCGERRTQERIAHTLKTGKPLRN